MVRRKMSKAPESMKIYIWMIQFEHVITLLWVWMLSSILGMVVEVKQMSTKDRLERKKYMGVCRWESEQTARVRSRFPNTVIRYMERKTPSRRGCSGGSLENPELIL